MPAYTKLFLFGGLVEVENPGVSETITRYYTIAGMRVAMCDGSNMFYFASDHLSSTSLVMNASGGVLADQRYYPFGEVRTEVGTWPTETQDGYTDLGYTGQRNYAGFGLMDYHARFYSPTLGRFTQPDTDVPASQGVQGLNRFAYVNNNPINYNDPTGHYMEGACGFDGCGKDSSAQAGHVSGYYRAYPTPEERLQAHLDYYDIEVQFNGSKDDEYQFNLGLLNFFNNVSREFSNNYMRGMDITVNREARDIWGIYDFDTNTMTLGDKYDDSTINHELWHAIDDNSNGELSSDFETYVGASTFAIKNFSGGIIYQRYNPGKDPTPSYPGTLNRQEDFAESGEEFFGFPGRRISAKDLRWQFFAALTTTGNVP